VRVAFVVADRIPMPGWRHLRWMSLVHAHVADLMIVVAKDDDFVRLLQQFDSAARENERHPTRSTLVARTRKADTGQRYFAGPLHNLRRVRLPPGIMLLSLRVRLRAALCSHFANLAVFVGLGRTDEKVS
jgi:hypothetical protein